MAELMAGIKSFFAQSEVDILLLSSLISLIVAWLTARLTYKSEHKKMLFERREPCYTELIQTIDRVINDHDVLFDHSFITSLQDIKYKTKLLATPRVNKVFCDYYEKVGKCLLEYINYCSENDPETLMVETIIDDYGDPVEVPRYTGSDMEWFELQCAKKREEIWKRESSAIKDLTYKLIDALRLDLGNKKHPRK